MPKVNEDYFSAKRKYILDSAYAVATSKPVHEVSMRDIISESGLSQGGIYRYFSNIDEIFITLVNSGSDAVSLGEDIDKVLLLDEHPEKILMRLFFIWKRITLDQILGVGKIYFELSILYANDKKRLANFMDNCLIVKEEALFQEKAFGYISKKLGEGYFSPLLPVDEIIRYLFASLDGIIRDSILAYHYQVNDAFQIANEWNTDKLVQSACTAFILLLGGNPDFIPKGEIK